MLYRVLTNTKSGESISFSDIKESAWYYESVNAMSQAGIINGYTDGTFRPENQITRAEFVTMIMQNKTLSEFDTIPFTDVKSDLWSVKYIYSAYKEKYIDGYEDNTFKPDNPITRAEAVKIINSVLGRNDYRNEKNPFGDVSQNHWAYKQILEAAVEHTK